MVTRGPKSTTLSESLYRHASAKSHQQSVKMTRKGRIQLTVIATVVALGLKKGPRNTPEIESRRKISTEIRSLKTVVEFLSMMKTLRAT